MGAGASKPPISGPGPAGIAFRRKLEEIRRRRKARAFRDSIVSTTELLKDGVDLESIGEVPRLSAVCLDADSPDPKSSLAVSVPETDEEDGSVKEFRFDIGPKPEVVKSAKPEVADTAISEPRDVVTTKSGPGEIAVNQTETGEVVEEKIIPEEEKRITEDRTEKAEAVEDVESSLADEVALLKLDDEGGKEREKEEEEKDKENEDDGRELGFVDLPGSPSFRYFAMINRPSAADSDDSDDTGETAHGKDDDESQEGNGGEPSKEAAENEGEESLQRKRKKRRGMKFRARSLARGPVAVCTTLLNVNACYCAPLDSPIRSPRRRSSMKHALIDHDKEKASSDEQPSSDKAAAGEKHTVVVQASVAA